jgi:hypothetical protein
MTRVDTEHLIEALANTATPVRPLPRPWVRGAIWLAIAVPYIALVVYVMSPRADLAAKITDTRYLIEQFAALATGIAAAVAAFSTTVPGYSRKALLLPVLPLAVWLGTLGQGCVNAWLQFGANGLLLLPDWFCLPAIAVVGALPAMAIAAMLRRGAPLMPCTTVALGGLAAAGLGNFGLRLFHPQDASLMVLVWQFGSVFILSALSASAGRLVLNWRSLVGAPPRSPIRTTTS